jgi:hypothetical protein
MSFGVFDVYVIDTFPCTTNHYKTSREESWCARKIASYETLEDAKEMVRIKSRQLTDLPHFLIDLSSTEEKEKMVDEFCFTNDMYLHYRRVFVGRPPIKAICNALTNQGVEVLKSK